MKKFTPLTFLTVALLFLIAVSSASLSDTSDDGLEKRNNGCSQSSYKRNVLGKRNNVKRCPCTLASSTFEGKATGFVIYSQDECGSTTITGFFSKGLDDPQQNNYTFAIADDCGNITNKLGTLDATFVDGGTKPFAQKFDNINLDCDQNGILLQKSAKSYKRNNVCKKTYYKRDGFRFLNIYSRGGFYSGTSINRF